MDFSAIGGLVASLKAASDLTKAAVTIRDEVVLRDKVIELQGLIMTAQTSAMAAQLDYMETADRLRQAETALAAARDWNTERARYKLTQISRGVFVLLLRDEEASSDPKHAICTTCAEQGMKAILQSQIDDDAHDTLRCPACKTAITANTEDPAYPFGAAPNRRRERNERANHIMASNSRGDDRAGY